MSKNNVYIWNERGYDYSRWISVIRRGADDCLINLGDVCQPGKLSRLSAVACPIEYLKTSLERGTLQITLSNGYLLLQRRDEVVSIEFRGREDVAAVKATFKAEDLRSRIVAAQEEAVLALHA